MADEKREWMNHFQECWGYVPLPKSGAIRPTKVHGWDDRGNDVRCTVLSKNLEPRTVNYPYKSLIEKGKFPSPENRLTNSGDFCYWSQVVPVRGVKKGLHLRNMNHHPLTGNVDLGDRAIPSEYDVAWGWVKPFPSFAESFERVNAGDALSRAFHPLWALQGQVGFDFPILMYKDTACGRIYTQTEIGLSPLYKMFSEFLQKSTGARVTYL